MKCPYCKKEHPDTTKFCPETGKPMPMLTWVCGNPFCDFREPLPLTAKFCPNCGKSCNAKTEKDSCVQPFSSDNIYGEIDEFHAFFPIEGFSLGDFAHEELDEILFDNIYTMTNLSQGGYVCDDEGRITSFFITRQCRMYKEWEANGFGWNLNYNEWLQLFRSKKYSIEIIESPEVVIDSILGGEMLQAEIIATAEDNSIAFGLTFAHGRHGYNRSSKSTLYSIEVARSKRDLSL